MSTNALEAQFPDIHVLAALDSTPSALVVAQRAKRLAELAHTPWEAVHVATPGDERAPTSERERLLEAFRLAESLGAETRTLNGDDPADEILAYARKRGVTHIVAGAPSRPLWFELISGSVTRRLVRNAGPISVELCGEGEGAERRPLDAGFRFSLPEEPEAYMFAAVAVGLATLFAFPLDRSFALPNVSLVYVLAVIAAAVRFGAGLAIVTAIASALAYNFFLTEPYYSFQISNPTDVWAVVFFLIIGLVVSGVAGRARTQTLIARRQAEQAEDLRAYAHSLVAAEEPTEIAAITTETASRLLEAHSVVLIQRKGELEVVAEAPGPEILGFDDMKAAAWAFTKCSEAGRGAEAVSEAKWMFFPASGERNVAGVVGVRPFDDAAPVDPEGRRLLTLIADQAGVALDRAQFARRASDSRVETESERLKGVLLASMSHDLRTPLATIRSGIESVLRYGNKHDQETQRSLLQGAAAEVEKLSNAFQNLLDVAQIDAGGVRVNREPAVVADVVDASIERSYRALEGRFVSRDFKIGLPRVAIDRALTETALANVFENAGRYSPEESTILVRAIRQGESVVVEILDEGPGFPTGAPPQLLGKFERGAEGDGRPWGMGLGLAVARGFLEAQGATIEVENRSGRTGACVRMALPIEKP